MARSSSNTAIAIGVGLLGLALLALGADRAPDDAPREKVEPLDGGRYRSPLKGAARKITPRGRFGAPRWNVGTSSTGTQPTDHRPPDRYHEGIDLDAAPREYVYPVEAGAVVPAAPGVGGIVVKVLHSDGRASIYADLSASYVQPGDQVDLATPIGRASVNGFVHVAIRSTENGRPLDPTSLVPHAGQA